jgi:hypothetical protein
MLDRYISKIEKIQADGAVILLKWDGQRPNNRYTIVITKSEVDYAWRQDSDDLEQSLQAALADYEITQGV